MIWKLQNNLLMKIFFLLLLSFSFGFGKHLHYEKFYQKIFCNKMGGVLEYKLNDGSRIDCLTKTYAIEVDFASKWAESIGQSLYYSLMSDKKAAVLLIMERKYKDVSKLQKLKKVAKKHGITVFTIDSELVIKRVK